MEQEKPLTPRQRDVLAEVARLQTLGENITTGRLAEHLGMPRQNVRMYLLILVERQLVHYDASERRTAVIQLSDRGRAYLHLPPVVLSLPIVGDVAAGPPGYTSEHVEGYATRLQDLLSLHEGDFLLRVRGESMIGIGIYPGDYVVIHPSAAEPHNGEIALVAVPGEDTATLKRWHRNNGTVTLFSENPDYPPMTFKTVDVLVQGCLVGHIGTGRARQTRHLDPRG